VGDVTDRETVGAEFLVARCHLVSIPIAISISMVPMSAYAALTQPYTCAGYF
jgi:hypothetical protein